MLKYKDCKKLGQKAQVGETVTWIVATIIIIAILIISVYAASLLANTKKTLSFQENRKSDLIMEKSLFAYFLAKDEDKNVLYGKLGQQEFFANLNDKKNKIKGVLENK